MKTSLLIAALSLLGFFGNDKLTGRWQSQPSEKGNVTSALFREDNSFEGYINQKPFVSGHYRLQDDLFSFTDNGCNGQEGVYKLIFFSNDDSLRFQPVSDSCEDRKRGMSRLVLGRAKQGAGNKIL